jgi:hypothetical protein
MGAEFDGFEELYQSALFLINPCHEKPGVYWKPLPGGCEVSAPVSGCYSYRVAISNHRLVSFAEDQPLFAVRPLINGVSSVLGM